jgi:hypothetical protein
MGKIAEEQKKFSDYQSLQSENIAAGKSAFPYPFGELIQAWRPYDGFTLDGSRRRQ